MFCEFPKVTLLKSNRASIQPRFFFIDFQFSECSFMSCYSATLDSSPESAKAIMYVEKCFQNFNFESDFFGEEMINFISMPVLINSFSRY